MRRIFVGLAATVALTAPLLGEESGPPKAPAITQAPPAIVASAAVSKAVTQVALATAGGTTVNPGPAVVHPYQEGQKLELAGALYSTRDGRIVLKSDAGEVFVLLENQNLWRMEQRAAFGEREFRVRGLVSKYQERYYLSVTKILETAIKLKDKRDSEEDERPFWDRLMFWKNS